VQEGRKFSCLRTTEHYGGGRIGGGEVADTLARGQKQKAKQSKDV